MEHPLYFLPVVLEFRWILSSGLSSRVPSGGERSPSLKRSKEPVAIELNLSAGELVLTVKDDGHPFNPLESAEPDTSLPVEDRTIGGLGIHLLRKMSDRMEYARVESKNQLTLHKSLSGLTIRRNQLNS